MFHYRVTVFHKMHEIDPNEVLSASWVSREILVHQLYLFA